MKILVIDPSNVGLSFCCRCIGAGHEVKWFGNTATSVGKGFKGLEKVGNWVGHVMWADLVFPTGTEFAQRLDFFREKGAKVFGPSLSSSKLDVETLKEQELNFIEPSFYPTIVAAAAYVVSTNGIFDATTKAGEFTAESPADMLNWLNCQEESTVKLEPKISGINLEVSRWLGSSGWIGTYNESFCCGSGIVCAFTKISLAGEATVDKLKDVLISLGHTGNVSVNLIIGDDGKVHVKQVNLSALPQKFNAMVGAITNDPAQWMLSALNDEDITSFKEDICYGVPIEYTFGGAPIYGVTKTNKKHVHPQLVRVDLRFDMQGERVIERPMWNAAGRNAIFVTGYGKDVKQSRYRASKTIAQLHAENAVKEVESDLETKLPKLHALGYAKHINYELR